MNNTELIKNKEQINSLLEKLRNKLRGFEVVNLEGKLIGRIHDFTLDKARRLYMVIPESDIQSDAPVYLLSSKYIQKVDTSNRILFLDLSVAKLDRLPLYRPANDRATEFMRHVPPPPPPANITSSDGTLERDESQPIPEPSLTGRTLEEGDRSIAESDNAPEVVEEEVVRLLEERLVVNRSQRKIGEVVVRKHIETQTIEVPIQSEKLIIDKLGSDSTEPVEIEQVPVYQPFNENGTESAPSSTSAATPVSVTSSGEARDIAQTQSPAEASQSFLASGNLSETTEEEIVRLLEERLVVNRSKWKVGEVVVRKEVETKIVQVPLRREKLIIEQVSPEAKQLAEFDFGKGEAIGVELPKGSSSDPSRTVVGQFLSPRAASNLLEAIALQGRHGCTKVRVELEVDDPELKETYQQMFDRCSGQ